MSGGGTTIAVPEAGFSPATLLARIKTVDGTGSGVDADLLDGQEGTYYRDAGNINAGTLASARGGTGVSNAGTITNASNTTITGGGTLALGGFTLTVPATGTAVLLSETQTITGAKTFSADLSVGLGTGTRYTILDGGNSGASGGAAFLIRNGGGNIFIFGNKSAILGGAYDATPYFGGTGTLELNINTAAQGTLSVAGVLTATGGLTVGTATLLTSNVALTNGAGASLGTLTDAPSAGNPTKWVPINDNGTTRYVPCW